MTRLAGKTAIITGGAGGIGRAAAELFIENGCKVVAVDVEEAALQTWCKGINSDQAAYCVADVSKPDDNAEMVATATKQFGGVDILLANAGIEGQVKSILEYDDDIYDRVMAVNVKGVWNGLRAVVPAMAERGGGSIVITSSVAGLRGSPSIAPYSTSKHAVIGLMRSAAKEFARLNIRVNTVNPSPVETRMMRSLESGMNPAGAAQAKARIASSIPMGRYANPREIAQAMLFLSSDDASWITGAVHAVDGGNTA